MNCVLSRIFLDVQIGPAFTEELNQAPKMIGSSRSAMVAAEQEKWIQVGCFYRGIQIIDPALNERKSVISLTFSALM